MFSLELIAQRFNTNRVGPPTLRTARSVIILYFQYYHYHNKLSQYIVNEI